jgi:hypothetical protein
VVAVGRWSLLCLALAAGASAAGAWCAAAGLPQLGVAAAAGAGLDPRRLLLVAAPGTGWPQVTAALLDGCEIVILCPPSPPSLGSLPPVPPSLSPSPPAPPSAQLRRRLEATVRRHRSVLLVTGDWPGAQTRLRLARQQWAGLGVGHGRLRARRVQVVADGPGAWARPRARWLWLPAPNGSVVMAAGSPAGTTTRVTVGSATEEEVGWTGHRADGTGLVASWPEADTG